MKRKISIFLSALLLVPVLLTGCGKDGKKLLEQAVANADAAKAYMLDFTMGCEVEASGSSVSLEVTTDFEMDKNYLHLNLGANNLLSAFLFGSYTPFSDDLYIALADGKITIYGKDAQTGNYIKTTEDAADAEFATVTKAFDIDAKTLTALSNISKSIKVTGTEEINSILCDVVTVHLDFAKIAKSSEAANATNANSKLDSNLETVLESLSDCIDVNFYISKNDVKIQSIRIATNDALIPTLKEAVAATQKEGSTTASELDAFKSITLEGGLTADYDNALPGIPAEVLAAQEVDADTFLENNSLFALFNTISPAKDLD